MVGIAMPRGEQGFAAARIIAGQELDVRESQRFGDILLWRAFCGQAHDERGTGGGQAFAGHDDSGAGLRRSGHL
jgi:hypothetical protein